MNTVRFFRVSFGFFGLAFDGVLCVVPTLRRATGVRRARSILPFSFVACVCGYSNTTCLRRLGGRPINHRRARLAPPANTSAVPSSVSEERRRNNESVFVRRRRPPVRQTPPPTPPTRLARSVGVAGCLAPVARTKPGKKKRKKKPK